MCVIYQIRESIKNNNHRSIKQMNCVISYDLTLSLVVIKKYLCIYLSANHQMRKQQVSNLIQC